MLTLGPRDTSLRIYFWIFHTRIYVYTHTYMYLYIFKSHCYLSFLLNAIELNFNWNKFELKISVEKDCNK